MILGPSGQNIYPEESEAVLNNHPLVADSLVVNRDNRITALIYPDPEAVRARKITEEELPAVMDKIRREANKELAAFMQVQKIEIMKEDFQRTPKKNIKRFKYQ
jgi:long-chain acyl-CoA synthetase